MIKPLCPKCKRRVFGERKHAICVSSDVAQIYVVHDYYGCDTGCCGHSVMLTNPLGETRRFFHFDHPYLERDHVFIKRLIKDTFNELNIDLNFDLIDYESCELLEDSC